MFLLAVGATGLFAFSKKNSPQTRSEIAPTVELSSVRSVASDGRYEVSALVRAADEAIVSSLLNGRVVLKVKEGQKVSRGQVLAVVEAPEYAARVRRASAELEAAEAAERNARRHWKDLSPDEREQIVANSRRARAAWREAEEYLAKTVVRSPVEGTVLSQEISSGQTVFAGTPLFRLGRKDLEAVVYLPAEVAIGLSVGQKTEVFVRGNRYEGEIAKLAFGAESLTAKTKATVSLPAQETLRPGEFVKIKFPFEDKVNLWSVPARALKSVYDDRKVFVFKDGVLEARRVEVVEAGNDRILVRGDLQEGEKVAVGDLSALKDGLQVTVRE